MKKIAAALSFALLAACVHAPAPEAPPVAETMPPRATGCVMVSDETETYFNGVIEDMMDPTSNFSHAAIRDTPGIKEIQEVEKERRRSDWGAVCQYKDDNLKVMAGPAPKVVFMGDSITQFWSNGDPVPFADGGVNRGISGQTTSQMVVRFWADVVALKPAVVHIMAGTNDLAENTGPVTDETYKNNIRTMVTLAQSRDISVVLASIPPAGSFGWRPELQPADRIETLNAWLESYAAETGAVYADYHSLLSDDGRRMSPEYTPDGVHPNRPGYLAIQAATLAAIAQAFAKDVSPAP